MGRCVVVGGTFALAVFLSYFKFLLYLETRYRYLFIFSGLIFVGGALGIEFIAGHVIDKHGVQSINHTFVQAIEESMEMAGSILFFYALSEYWRHTFNEIRLPLTARRHGDQP